MSLAISKTNQKNILSSNVNYNVWSTHHPLSPSPLLSLSPMEGTTDEDGSPTMGPSHPSPAACKGRRGIG